MHVETKESLATDRLSLTSSLRMMSVASADTPSNSGKSKPKRPRITLPSDSASSSPMNGDSPDSLPHNRYVFAARRTSRARYMLLAVGPYVRPTLRLSHAGILWKRLNDHRVIHAAWLLRDSSFTTPKIWANSPPVRSSPNAHTIAKICDFSTNVSIHLRNVTGYGQSYSFSTGSEDRHRAKTCRAEPRPPAVERIHYVAL